MREQSWQNEVMRWETDHVRRLPLGGKLSPKVTDEGATLYPTEGQKEHRCLDGTIVRHRFSCHVGYEIAPSSDPADAGPPSPRVNSE